MSEPHECLDQYRDEFCYKCVQQAESELSALKLELEKSKARCEELTTLGKWQEQIIDADCTKIQSLQADLAAARHAASQWLETANERLKELDAAKKEQEGLSGYTISDVNMLHRTINSLEQQLSETQAKLSGSEERNQILLKNLQERQAKLEEAEGTLKECEELSTDRFLRTVDLHAKLASLNSDALGALADVVCTPLEGYIEAPHCLSANIQELKTRMQEAEKRIKAFYNLAWLRGEAQAQALLGGGEIIVPSSATVGAIFQKNIELKDKLAAQNKVIERASELLKIGLEIPGFQNFKEAIKAFLGEIGKI